MVKHNNRWYFLYTFSGERIATIDWQGSIASREVDWTIRGPDNQVLSTFKLVGEDQAGNWSREIDYIWMGRRLLGTETDPGGPNATVKHYHTDHLGSIRLVTDSAGNKVSEHEYLPYGQELTAPGDGVMKFTGHERDGETGMDYMHARFYSSFLGRFNSVDPILGGGGVLNRYSYVGGKPLGLTDPTGMATSQSINCHYSSGAAVILGSLTGTCPTGGGGSYEPSSDEVFGALVDSAPYDIVRTEPLSEAEKKGEVLSEQTDANGQIVQHVRHGNEVWVVVYDENGNFVDGQLSELITVTAMSSGGCVSMASACVDPRHPLARQGVFAGRQYVADEVIGAFAAGYGNAYIGVASVAAGMGTASAARASVTAGRYILATEFGINFGAGYQAGSRGLPFTPVGGSLSARLGGRIGHGLGVYNTTVGIEGTIRYIFGIFD